MPKHRCTASIAAACGAELVLEQTEAHLTGKLSRRIRGLVAMVLIPRLVGAVRCLLIIPQGILVRQSSRPDTWVDLSLVF